MELIAKIRNLHINYSYIITAPVRGAVSNAIDERLSPVQITDILNKITILERDGKSTPEISIDKILNKEFINCSAGITSYCITWDGNMLPCTLLNHPYTTPFESGFIESWDKLKKKTEQITFPKECIVCEHRLHCIVCPAKIQAETNTFEKVHPYICEIGKNLK